MAGEVKWIKIVTDIFDDEKILLIESLPESDAIIVIWFKLLCLAGKQNNSGVFMMNEKIAYTDKMLSTIFRRKESTVHLALKTFADFGMIEIVEGVITIPNWEKHQQLDQLEMSKEKTRLRVAKHREMQKIKALGEKKLLEQARECNVTDNVTETESNAYRVEKNRIDKNRIDKNKKEDKEKENTPYEEIKTLYQDICKSYPKIRSLSDNRKKTLKARYNENNCDIEVFKELFMRAEESDFLTGKTSNWKADFDWMINQANMIKILEGKYNNKGEKKDNKYDLSHLSVSNNVNDDIEGMIERGEIM